ncbi:MAG: hypothetical protein ACJAU0_002314 [Flavobacteriales bacterium]|jgi:hypothetical protein
MKSKKANHFEKNRLAFFLQHWLIPKRVFSITYSPFRHKKTANPTSEEDVIGGKRNKYTEL